MMLIAVGPAFLLHEIGHKIVAKRHGCWAEFRADPKGLRFGVCWPRCSASSSWRPVR